MSSSPSLTSDPFAPPTPHNLPCMFTVEQFQQAAPSQGSNSDPSNVYIVRPTAIWESLERFKRLVIQGDKEKYQTYDTITVTRHDLPNSPLWTALILEIRGHKPSAQVFLRLFWFYEPSHLPPSLRQSHHGRHELLASNAMAVVDATAVVNRVHVSPWREGNEPLPTPGRSFWRQTYDVQRQELSPLQTPCSSPTCPQPPQNPDNDPLDPLLDLLLACPSPTCTALMHKSCLLNATLARLQAETSTSTSPSSNNKKKAKKKEKKLPSLSAKWTDEGTEGYGILISEGGQGG